MRNPRGAGRKPQPFKSKQVRVPVDLIEQVKVLIEKYKSEFNEKGDL